MKISRLPLKRHYSLSALRPPVSGRCLFLAELIWIPLNAVFLNNVCIGSKKEKGMDLQLITPQLYLSIFYVFQDCMGLDYPVYDRKRIEEDYMWLAVLMLSCSGEILIVSVTGTKDGVNCCCLNSLRRKRWIWDADGPYEATWSAVLWRFINVTKGESWRFSSMEHQKIIWRMKRTQR